MTLHQIIIRPQGDVVTLLYIDKIGRRDTMVLDASQIPGLAQVVSECESRLPSDINHPAKAEIQLEIAELEKRVTQLKEAIGVT